uniref:BZIP domain-containing protein n=1 Tax=Denticeps clupeoides TaxID=299321 RepID=A0AAY4D9E9_9TELE
MFSLRWKGVYFAAKLPGRRTRAPPAGALDASSRNTPGFPPAAGGLLFPPVLPGSGATVLPTGILTDITSNRELQWMLQPSILGPAGPPYSTGPGINAITSHPGLMRASTTSGSSTRRRSDEHLSLEELERRRLRRERNKLAAAKCRNRRRELTDKLQNETDELEDEKSRLQKEIADLHKQKEKLELVLEAHRPICKAPDSDSDSDSRPAMPSLGDIKMEPDEPELPGPSTQKPRPRMSIPAPPPTACHEGEALHTPVLLSTPALTPLPAGLVFTYPPAPLSHAAPAAQHPQTCSSAHRRSSSSGDQSDHSLNSPPVLSL